jgi:sRNA-binding regulator protein Hfq
MKNNTQPLDPNHEADAQEFVNRKLIRPAMPVRSESAHAVDAGSGAAAAPAREPEIKREKRASGPRPVFSGGEQTHAENFYFQKQMQAQTPMTFMLKNGESVQGIIEWYDTRCIKLNRPGRGSMLLYKTGIRYLHKTGE